MKRIREKLKRLQYHYVYKLFFSYLAFLLLVLSVVLSFTWYHLTKNELNQGIRTYTSVLDQSANYVRFSVSEIRGIVDTITNVESTVNALQDGERYYSHNTENWNIYTSNGHRQITYNLFSSNSISSISLHSMSGQLSLKETNEYSDLTTEQQSVFNDRIEYMKGTYTWLPSSILYADNSIHSSVTYVRKLPAPKHLGQYIGYATARIPNSVFEDIIMQMQMTPQSQAILFNSENEVIAHTNTDEEFMKEIIKASQTGTMPLTGDISNVSIRGMKYLAGIRSIPGSDWTLAITVPYRDITASIYSSLLSFIVLVSAAVLASLPVIYYISRKLTGRIVNLKSEMVRFSENTEINVLLPEKQDEIGDLTTAFYTMRKNIRDLMEEQYRNGFEIKDLELQILQSQINPHFLYNTLETIYWMGMKKGAPEVSVLAQKLGSFYQVSLSNGKVIVPLSTELQHVQDYTDIQNIRFGQRIQLSIVVPLDIQKYKIPKITLQPLVENAIQHGIREKEDERGVITISAFIDEKNEESNLIITITDDGIGMNKEQVEKMLEKNTKISGHGYGVWNINERIRMMYGKQYGLHYSSVEGKGTTVTIIIPAMIYEE